MIYEVIVCSVEDAIAAEQGGANRLEIISHYEAGGLTPSFPLVREIVEVVKIPARVMLRDEESFVITDEKKIERLCETARSFLELPIDGFVLGFLKGNEIDHGLVARVLACVPILKATFHRAFEEVADPLQAIPELKRHPQIDCILTSGGPEPFRLGGAKLARFESWQQASQPEINILVGGGTDAKAISLLCHAPTIRAFHVGRAVREGQRLDGKVQEDLVKELADLIKKYQGRQ